MEYDAPSEQALCNFAIICVLGPPGAGKGTICTHLAHQYNLLHYSIGDNLRSWMRLHQGYPLATQIKDRLDNQGFLPFCDLEPFLTQAIRDALNRDGSRTAGILIDGFPRCIEQLEAFDAWQIPSELQRALTSTREIQIASKPDVVLSLEVTKETARCRYVKRERDSNDKQDKFERRFNEYIAETRAVEHVYEQRNILIEINANGTREDVIDEMARKLELDENWIRQNTPMGISCEHAVSHATDVPKN